MLRNYPKALGESGNYRGASANKAKAANGAEPLTPARGGGWNMDGIPPIAPRRGPHPRPGGIYVGSAGEVFGEHAGREAEHESGQLIR